MRGVKVQATKRAKEATTRIVAAAAQVSTIFTSSQGEVERLMSTSNVKRVAVHASIV